MNIVADKMVIMSKRLMAYSSKASNTVESIDAATFMTVKSPEELWKLSKASPSSIYDPPRSTALNPAAIKSKRNL